jgi:hypothetical protein
MYKPRRSLQQIFSLHDPVVEIHGEYSDVEGSGSSSLASQPEARLVRNRQIPLSILSLVVREQHQPIRSPIALSHAY